MSILWALPSNPHVSCTFCCGRKFIRILYFPASMFNKMCIWSIQKYIDFFSALNDITFVLCRPSELIVHLRTRKECQLPISCNAGKSLTLFALIILDIRRFWYENQIEICCKCFKTFITKKKFFVSYFNEMTYFRRK